MKSNLDQFFKTDQSLENQGIWFKVSDDTKFLITRFGGSNSHKVKGAMAKYYKPYARQIEAGSFDVAQEREIMIKVFVYSSLIGWEGVEIDGAPCEFSKEKAVELLVSLPDLAEALMSYAQDSKSYKEDLGNF
jgi:hypothetical protein